MENQSETLAARTLVPKVIWGALALSQFMYLFVLHTMQAKWTANEALTVDPLFSKLMTGAAAFLGLMSIALFRKFLSTAPLRQRVRVDGPLKTINSTFVFHIVCWALNEAVCLNGFLLGVINQDATRFYPFLVAGLFLQFSMFPRLDAAIKG